MARVDCWTVDDVVKNVAAAANSSVVKRVTVEDNTFRDFKTVLRELYKPLRAVQKYHIFSANKESSGVIMCRTSPDDAGILKDLRRNFDKPNTEKIDQMHRKGHPFVPSEFQNDPLYAAPTADEAAQSKNTKRA
ncbi:hypothetical protein PC123_g24739 [Phytophthora cactorum]|nr:hypothetical protein PC123_g24739 [Phytophthora cactorum]